MLNDLGYVNLTGEAPPGRTTVKDVGWLADRMLFWWGFVVPVLALIVENRYHICARQFFDPFPTQWHTYLFAIIPATNFLAWLALRVNLSNYFGLILFANGTAIGVAILYSLMFLPVVPASMLFIFGLGILGLAPMLSLVSLIKAGKVIEHESTRYGTYFNPKQVHNLGHIIILLAIVAIELPSTYTRIALSLAVEPHSEKQGLDMLRLAGSQEVMLRACYERSGRATDIVGSLYESHKHMNVEEARKAFYRATGRTFNSFPIPENARATLQHIGSTVDDGAPTDEFDQDPDIAGEMVSGVSRGLSASGSTINAVIDPEAAIAKIDWRMTFSNTSRYDREMRTRISLPPGGVVDQASLIVDGVEYEANIMVKEEARAVYQAAVAAKQNPLLVSVCGQDRVLVQCFPVPPKNRNNVVLRLGIVAPITLESGNANGSLALPQFEERNFQIDVPHQVSIQSPELLIAERWKGQAVPNSSGGTSLSGTMDSAELAKGAGLIAVGRRGDVKSFWCRDQYAPFQSIPQAQVPAAPVPSCGPVGPDCCIATPQMVRESRIAPLPAAYPIAIERMQEVEVNDLNSLHVVIDGSYAMAPYSDDLEKTLDALPANCTVSISIAGDEGAVLLTPQPVSKESNPDEFHRAISRVGSWHYVGGQENGGALLQQLPLQYCERLLWIHGAQPVDSYQSETVRTMLLQNPSAYLYDMQIASGPNTVLNGLDSKAPVRRVAHEGTVQADLMRLVSTWSGSRSTDRTFENTARPGQRCSAFFNAVRPGGLIYEPVRMDAPSPTSGAQTMPELAQLAAYQRILADIKQGDYNSTQDALELARKYHIVTPLSSAILVVDVPAFATLTPAPPPEDGCAALSRDLSPLAQAPLAVVGAVGAIITAPFRMMLKGAVDGSYNTIVAQLNSLNREECNSIRQSTTSEPWTPPVKDFNFFAEQKAQKEVAKKAEAINEEGGYFRNERSVLMKQKRDNFDMPMEGSATGNYSAPEREAPAAPPPAVMSAVPAPAAKPADSESAQVGGEIATPLPQRQMASLRAKTRSNTAVDDFRSDASAGARAGGGGSASHGIDESDGLESLGNAFDSTASTGVQTDKKGLVGGKDLAPSFSPSPRAAAPSMSGVTNGTIGPQSGDAAPIQGVTTSGTIRTEQEKSNNVWKNITDMVAKPVPESDTWWLLLASLVVLAIAVVRRKFMARKA